MRGKKVSVFARRFFRLLGINLGVVIVLFTLIEGASSLFLLAKTVIQKSKPVIAEDQHTVYDPLLGWANKKNIHLPNLYEKNVGLTINEAGFRDTRPLALKKPAGEYRMVCLGDSFTLGYGVDDKQTWCVQLESKIPGVRSVNMGQGGYGIDQMYLWYQRDAIFEHDHLVLAFLDIDIDRMGPDRFFAYGKPVLAIEHGALVTKNTPVPRWGHLFPWLTQNFALLRESQTYRLLENTGVGGELAQPAQRENLMPVAYRAIEELAKRARASGAKFTLVYLPGRWNYRNAYTRDLAGKMAGWAGNHQIPFVDVSAMLDAVPPEEVDSLFIREGEIKYPASAGHFNAKGNGRLAELLAKAIALTPERTPVL